MNSAGQYQRFLNQRLGLREFRQPAAGTPRLIGLPYAGGQSLAFRPLAEHLPVGWGLAAIDLPGHGWTSGPPLDRIEPLAEVCLEGLPETLWDGAILYGHSMGGCVAWRLAERLTAQGRPPLALVLGATRPPHLNDQYGSFLTLTDSELLDLLIRLGGIPQEWASQPDVFALFRDALRADFTAFEQFAGSPLPGELPLLALGATLDRVCRPEHVGEWSRWAPQVVVEFLSTDHLFVQTHPELVAARLERFVRGLRPTAHKVAP